jgi:iron complex outermembrane receptor protein
MLSGSVMLSPAAAAAQELALAARSPRFLLATQSSDRSPVEVNPSRVESLRHKVTLNLRDVRLGAALDAIARQAGIKFVYVHGALPVDSVVQFRAEGLSVAAALTELLLGTPVNVLVNGTNQVVLVRAEDRAAPGSVSGRVTDAKTGVGLSGVEVALEGARGRVVTGDDGRYRLADIAPGSYTLVVKRLGYAPVRQAVTVADGQELTVDVTLEPRPTALDEVVVTGTMTPTAVKAVPTPVSVITAEQIEQQRIRNYAQLLRQLVPSLRAWEDGTSPDMNAMMVRGASSLQSGVLKVYLDGVQVAHNIFSQVDPQSIERIEIIRGPQAAAIYGSDAIGGVIEIFTKRGDHTLERLQGSVQTALGAIESKYRDNAALRQDYRAELRGASGNASFNLGGGYSRDGEWVDLYSASKPSAYGGMRFEQGPFALDLTARYYGQNYHLAFDPNYKATGLSSFQKPDYRRLQGRDETYGIQLRYKATPGWQHQLLLGTDRNSWMSETYRPRLLTPDDTLLGFQEFGYNRLSVAYRSSLTTRLSPALDAVITAGVDYSLFRSGLVTYSGIHNLIGTIATDPTAFTMVTRDRTTNAGYFTQAQLGFRDALFLTGSVRLEDNSNFGEDIGRPVSPRVGLSFVQALGGATLKLRSAYGEALMSPSFRQKAGETTPWSITEPNPALRPERQVGPEFGADLVFGSRASLGATYYRQTAKDLINLTYLTPIDGTTVVRYQNVGRVRNEGLELEGRADLAGVQLTGQYAYTSSKLLDPGPDYSGEERVGEQISFVPQHTAGATLSFTPLRRLGVTAGMAYVGSRNEVDWLQLYSCLGGTGSCGDYLETGDMRAFWVRLPAFAKFNLALDYALRPGLTSYLAVENLANSNPIEGSSSILLPGRITTLGLRKQF